MGTDLFSTNVVTDKGEGGGKEAELCQEFLLQRESAEEDKEKQRLRLGRWSESPKLQGVNSKAEHKTRRAEPGCSLPICTASYSQEFF